MQNEGSSLICRTECAFMEDPKGDTSTLRPFHFYPPLGESDFEPEGDFSISLGPFMLAGCFYSFKTL